MVMTQPLASSRLLLVFSMLIASVLMIVPWPPAWLKPYWVALLLIYWLLESGHLRRLGTVFVIGLLVDLLTGTLFGQHALSLLIMAYLLSLFRHRIQFFSAPQQTLVVFMLLVNDRVLQLWVLSLSGMLPGWEYWLQPLVSAAVWPWLFLLMDRLRSHLRQRGRN
ncbi:MAG: rod shape-determining protein MreD [Wenzhouxiangellaceae bacterium]